ncbi:CDP-glycerol glycerophosphotransferase family protein [Cobetia sp. 29-18-1]|uniref:bifunctional glycosyltransferase/CDP-glycerol:glycerophosphate glycerophosphotransferase n=1 Tax=Cobetia sp. 29-18-1 TaxID=3040018 RepID=UPI00244ABD0B|nr:CDP-glycerol glycerophosphotransferase family protein [Cobetia sp. 29-18-1]MDH2299244.1 CDP-glycerol glycerophosphotransferase family protein [Cobetia sp. 29-18-1]
MSIVVSVIIPAYNAENYIDRCLNSVLNQSFSNFELLVVNDGSCDNTLNIVQSYSDRINNLKVFDVKNGGQGKARNIALNEAIGDYVFFLDADDEIVELAIEKLVNNAEENNSDVVVCDYHFKNEENNYFGYSNFPALFENTFLDKESIKKLLTRTLFPVNKLYRRQYILNNHISFGEGYIYEDIEFGVGALCSGGVITYSPFPLYVINVNSNSTTKKDYNTTKHSDGFIKAIENSIAKHDQVIEGYSSVFIKNMFSKAYFYTIVQGRIPKKQYYDFSISLLSALSPIAGGEATKKLGRRYRYPLDLVNNYNFMASCAFYTLNWLHRTKKKSLSPSAYIANLVKGLFTKPHVSSSLSIKDNVLLFHGFNGSIKGNTKYLLMQADSLNENLEIYVLVDDESLIPDVPLRRNINYVIKGTPEYKSVLGIAKFHIFETWVPNNLEKKEGMVWIQLWHGSPIKRMLFDSDERFIMKKTKKHKLRKFHDLLRWDYILSQNHFCTDKIRSSFQISKDKILEFGYPRNINIHQSKIETLRLKYQSMAGNDKPILLYAPTWRDYNQYGYGNDLSYMPKFGCSGLMDKYTIIYCGHSFGSDLLDKDVIVKDVLDDIQELIYVADVLVTDYSSILFDWLPTKKKFVLLWNDQQLFKYARGIYPEIERDFSDFIVDSDFKIHNLLKTDDKSIDNIEKYIEFSEKSSDRLIEMINSLSQQKAHDKDVKWKR